MKKKTIQYSTLTFVSFHYEDVFKGVLWISLSAADDGDDDNDTCFVVPMQWNQANQDHPIGSGAYELSWCSSVIEVDDRKIK